MPSKKSCAVFCYCLKLGTEVLILMRKARCFIDAILGKLVCLRGHKLPLYFYLCLLNIHTVFYSLMFLVAVELCIIVLKVA